jgi:two-component system response regulator FixJ
MASDTNRDRFPIGLRASVDLPLRDSYVDSTLTVYIVDDDPIVRRTVCAMVESAGLTTRVSGSAEEFLDTFDGQRNACLVLDIQLPGMSGLELLEQLRRSHVTLPVIMMTGTANSSLVARCMKAGASDFVEKAALCDPQVLPARIRRAVLLGFGEAGSRDTTPQGTVRP